MPRIARDEVERLMAERPGTTLEAALGVFEVFASGSLTDEVYVLDDVSGKRIAIAMSSVTISLKLYGPCAPVQGERRKPRQATGDHD